MTYYKKALAKFIDENQEELECVFYDYCMENCPEWGHVNYMKEVLHDKVFEEWVEESHYAEIEIIEEILKQENIEASKESKEYSGQVESDYKKAQTGEY